jgi:hypothetical protein
MLGCSSLPMGDLDGSFSGDYVVEDEMQEIGNRPKPDKEGMERSRFKM